MQPTTQQDVAEYYDRVRLETSPVKNSIYLLHEKAAYLLNKALAFEHGRRATLNRVQNILSQLQASLVVDDSVGEGLFHLYRHCYSLLESEDKQSMQAAYRILFPLKHTFKILLSRP